MTEEFFGSDGVISYVAGVVEHGGLADGDEVVEEFLAGVGEGRVGERVEGGAKADFVPGEDLERRGRVCFSR